MFAFMSHNLAHFLKHQILISWSWKDNFLSQFWGPPMALWGR